MTRPAVQITHVEGGRPVCTCHGWSVRLINRKSGAVDYVHCEHPEAYIERGDGYISDYCEKCGWRA